MTKFEGFEIVPAASLGYSRSDTIRITVSPVRVSLSNALIDAMGKPTAITFHRGVDKNAGRIIIAAAVEEGIQINPEKKRICFSHSEFTDVCVEMVQTYAHGSFRKGTYYSISGTKVDEDAYIFDFRNAMEHNVRVWEHAAVPVVGRGGQGVQGAQGMQGAQPRPYNMQGQFGIVDRGK